MATATASILDLSSAKVFAGPFPYFTALDAFRLRLSFEILNWLEVDAPWTLVETDFYEQYEFNFEDVMPPSNLTFLYEAGFLSHVKSEVERVFRTKLGHRVDLTAHKLIPGQRIRIHNDFIQGQETHRLIIQLNRGWDNENGGYLLFFNSPEPSDVHKLLRPTHNSIVGFAITPDSHHAVSTIHHGERFTLVYSFYAKTDAFLIV